jgi:hypothetical protein
VAVSQGRAGDQAGREGFPGDWHRLPRRDASLAELLCAHRPHRRITGRSVVRLVVTLAELGEVYLIHLGKIGGIRVGQMLDTLPTAFRLAWAGLLIGLYGAPRC